MDKIAHIHLKGPFIKAAKALIPEKPVSLGWDTRLPEARWAFIFKGSPSERAIKAASKTGLHFQQEDSYSSISLPGVKEKEIDKAKERFNIFAEEYRSVSKKAAAIINSHINEDATVIKSISVKAGRRQLMSVAECLRQFYATIDTKE